MECVFGTDPEALAARESMPEPAGCPEVFMKMPAPRIRPMVCDFGFDEPAISHSRTIDFQRVRVSTESGAVFWAWTHKGQIYL